MRGVARGAAVALSLTALGAGGATFPAAVPPDRRELDGAIVGRVCHDLDGNGVCSASEPGLLGVRVVLETGQEARTDAQGRFHLASVRSGAPEVFRTRAGHGEGSLDWGGGRHRLRVDARPLPAGTRIVPEVATVAVPMGGLLLQDFAILPPATPNASQLVRDFSVPPLAERGEQGLVLYRFSARAGPDEQVEVDGRPVPVDRNSGVFSALVGLGVGANLVTYQTTNSNGVVSLWLQAIDRVARPGGSLIIPREPEEVCTVKLPGDRNAPAPVGKIVLGVTAAPGTQVRWGEAQVVAGEDGRATLPLTLSQGENEITLEVDPGSGRGLAKLKLKILAMPAGFWVGLAEVEGSYSPRKRTWGLRGAGAGHGETSWRGWNLAGELVLRDQDVIDAAARPAILAGPRRPEALERVVDPEAQPAVYGDNSVGLAPNEAEGRVRIRGSNPELGEAGFGTHRASFADSEVGRYQRELFGPYADLHSPPGTYQAGLRAFADPGVGDPSRQVTTVPAHEEFWGTGGSVFFLRHGFVSAGSEVVRIELQDGLTHAPVGERHLRRGEDYEIDAVSGRVLLAEPLGFFERRSGGAASADSVLVVDYEHAVLGEEGRRSAGGEVWGAAGPFKLSAGTVQDRGGAKAFSLFRGRGSVSLGLGTLSLEAAQSRGSAFPAGDFALSDDGGLGFLEPDSRVSSASQPGQAIGLKVRTQRGFTQKGHWGGTLRKRNASFSDGAHEDRAPTRQLAADGEEVLGGFFVGGAVDDSELGDPRVPFLEGRTVSARVVKGALGYRAQAWEVELEPRDRAMTAAEDPWEGDPHSGGRFSLGVSGKYRPTHELTLHAGHRQVVALRGEGPGRFDDTFTSAGGEAEVSKGVRAGVGGGWGPSLGPLAWASGSVRTGAETRYGSYSVDVDAPAFSERRVVSGAKREIDADTVVFAEDVSAHDSESLRLLRAVGFSQALTDSLRIAGRYERGVRQPLELASSLNRDAGGLSAAFTRKRYRLYGRCEARSDRGVYDRRSLHGAAARVERLQLLTSGAAEVEVTREVRASGRLNYVDSTNFRRREAKLVEGEAGVAWRRDPVALVTRYSVTRELPPPSRGAWTERTTQIVSLMPSVRLGRRFAVSSGGHVGFAEEAGSTRVVFSGSLRPSLNVVFGLELAAEVARRSAAPDGGELSAVRAEAGYRFDESFLVALGYTIMGYSGLGLVSSPADNPDRIYLRAEVGY